RHAAQAEHGDAGGALEGAGWRRRGGAAHHRRAARQRAGGGAGDRVPLGRTIRRGGDGQPVGDQPARAASVGGHLLVWAGPAARGAVGLGRGGGKCSGGAGGLRAPGQNERTGGLRGLAAGSRPGRLTYLLPELAVIDRASDIRPAMTAQIFLIAPADADANLCVRVLDEALAASPV